MRHFPENQAFYDDSSILNEDVQDCIDIWEVTKFYNDCQKPSDRSWNSVRMLQTVILSKQGTGKPITIDFYAPLDKSADTHINYDFRAFGDEIAMIKAGDDRKYCLK